MKFTPTFLATLFMAASSLPSLHAQDQSIRPFRVHVEDSMLTDLRERLARTRWPDELNGVGWDYGVPLDYLRELTDYLGGQK